jgi:hypothetical protein
MTNRRAHWGWLAVLWTVAVMTFQSAFDKYAQQQLPDDPTSWIANHPTTAHLTFTAAAALGTFFLVRRYYQTRSHTPHTPEHLPVQMGTASEHRTFAQSDPVWRSFCALYDEGKHLLQVIQRSGDGVDDASAWLSRVEQFTVLSMRKEHLVLTGPSRSLIDKGWPWDIKRQRAIEGLAFALGRMRDVANGAGLSIIDPN